MLNGEALAKTSQLRSGFGIHRVYVEDLFGRYTYNLSLPPDLFDAARLMILYGENGSGKTTLLKLIVNLLSHVDNRGHKKRVAKVKFRRFVIWVGSFIVEARRGTLEEESFTATVSDADSNLLAQADYYIAESEKSLERERSHKQLLKALEDIQVDLFFLADDRKVTSNVLVESSDSEHLEDTDFLIDVTGKFRTLHGDLATRQRKVADKVLEDAITRVTSWATRTALKASTQGEEDVNTIYGRIIQQLAKSSVRKEAKPDQPIDVLLPMLQTQYQRSLEFSQFGLTSPPQIDKMIASMTKAPKSARKAIGKVLSPYIDSMKARLDALQSVQASISSFVESINTFYTDKTITFDLRRGPRIRTREGQTLKPTMLSSGERQLLLLFCNIVVAKQRPSIFIIDEPELSLNVKWQRQLVHALLAVTKASQMQFILATHSIELLTRHKEYVVDLTENAKIPLQ